MKAIRTTTEYCPNPLFSHAAKRAARERGQVYDTQERLIQPEGQIIDGPECWVIVAIGKALPDDVECAKRVLDHLGQDARKETAKDILLLREASKTSQLSAKDKDYLDRMERTYAVDLNLLPADIDPKAKAEKIVATKPAVTDEPSP